MRGRRSPPCLRRLAGWLVGRVTPVALLRPRSYKKFVKYLSKELKANGKAFDFTIAGAKWASQEEGHEFKFEFGEA